MTYPTRILFSFIWILPIVFMFFSCTCGSPGDDSSATNDDTHPGMDDDSASQDDTNSNDDSADDVFTDDDDTSYEDHLPKVDANQCCLDSDPCAMANNGLCECPFLAWDRADCENVCSRGLIPYYPDDPGITINGVFYQRILAPAPYGPTFAALGPDGSRYFIMTPGDMLYLYKFTTATGWTRETIAYFATNARAAMDSAGHFHVAYQGSGTASQGTGIRYATNISGNWEIEVVNSDPMLSNPAIAVDASGFVHIAYVDNSSGIVLYATNASGTWSFKALGYGESPSIATDPDGYVHITMVYLLTPVMPYLAYITNSGGFWSASVFDDGLFFKFLLWGDYANPPHPFGMPHQPP